MRYEEVVRILLRAAEVSGRREFVVIGSQAIHGSSADPALDVVLRSDDIDIYPADGYTPVVYEELMLQLGQDSDYHVQTGQYIEAVSETLARFPPGWERRMLRAPIGSIAIDGAEREVLVGWPEIHDLVVSKLAVGRDKDVEFLRGVVSLGLVNRDTLRERYCVAPRITEARLTQGLAQIDEAFG